MDVSKVKLRVYTSSDWLYDHMLKQIDKSDNTPFPLHVLLHADEEGDIALDDIPYLATGMMPEIREHKLFFLAWNEEMTKVLGAIVLRYGTEQATMRQNDHWISSIGVHPDYEGKGIARRLAEECFSFCREFGIHRLEQSSYSKKGLCLIPMFERLAEENPWMEFIDDKTFL